MEQTGSFVEAPAKPEKKKKPPVQFVAEVKPESQGQDQGLSDLHDDFTGFNSDFNPNLNNQMEYRSQPSDDPADMEGLDPVQVMEYDQHEDINEQSQQILQPIPEEGSFVQSEIM